MVDSSLDPSRLDESNGPNPKDVNLKGGLLEARMYRDVVAGPFLIGIALFIAINKLVWYFWISTTSESSFKEMEAWGWCLHNTWIVWDPKNGPKFPAFGFVWFNSTEGSLWWGFQVLFDQIYYKINNKNRIWYRWTHFDRRIGHLISFSVLVHRFSMDGSKFGTIMKAKCGLHMQTVWHSSRIQCRPFVVHLNPSIH